LSPAQPLPSTLPTAYCQACFLALDLILGDLKTWLKSAKQVGRREDQLRGPLEHNTKVFERDPSSVFRPHETVRP
ncbi:hypothetical protein FJTKL_14215, partial [Diaporthe vaccinii]